MGSNEGACVYNFGSGDALALCLDAAPQQLASDSAHPPALRLLTAHSTPQDKIIYQVVA